MHQHDTFHAQQCEQQQSRNLLGCHNTPLNTCAPPARRLLCVEHVEENSKPCLYLVSKRAAVSTQRRGEAARCSAHITALSSGCHEQQLRSPLGGLTPVCAVLCCVLQVFEYLTTDLKKYMDRTGKGPSFPLPKPTIKVRHDGMQCARAQH